MKLTPWWLPCLLLPALAGGAEKAQQDFNRALAAKPDAQRGAELFQQCAGCHGEEGGGTIAGTTPRIAGQHYRVLLRQLVDFRHGKRWDFRMEGVATSHEVIPEIQDIADVAWHVSQLQRDGVRGVGDGQYVDTGRALYEAKCAACHGARGEGHERRGIPKIAGQHAAYLSRQFYDAIDGRRPLLTRTHKRHFEPLAFDQVLGLADYLSRIGWDSGGERN